MNDCTIDELQYLGFNYTKGQFKDNNPDLEWFPDQLSLMKKLTAKSGIIIRLIQVDGCWRVDMIIPDGVYAKQLVEEKLKGHFMEEVCAFIRENPGTGSDF